MGAFSQRYRRATAKDFGTVILDIDPNLSSSVTLSSGKVSSIVDVFGNYTFSQATGGSQPTYSASDSNFAGKASMTFSGGQILDSTATITGGATKMCVALAYRPSVNTTGMALETAPIGANVGSFGLLTGVNGAGTQGIDISGTTPASQSTKQNSLTANTKYRLISTWDYSVAGGAVGQTANGVAGTNVLTAMNAATLGTFVWHIGGRNGGSVFFSGSIARLIVFSSAVDSVGIDTWFQTLYF